MNREEAVSQKCIQNRDTLTSFLNHLTKPSPKVEWLLKVGEQLRNEHRETGVANNAPVNNHGE